MPTNQLEDIKQLLEALRPGEFSNLELYLSTFHKMYGDYEPKTLRLLKAIQQNPRWGAERLREEISPGSSENTFRMLINRLRMKVLECLTLDFNLHRNEAYSLAYVALVDGRKQLSQAEILHSRGLTRQAKALTDRILRLAKKYELHDLWLEVLAFRQMIAIIRGRPESQYEVERQRVGETKQLIWNVKKAYYQSAGKDQRFSSDSLQSQELEEKVDYFDRELHRMPSAMGRYWWYLLALHFREKVERFASALALSEYLYEHVRRYPAVQMRRRLGSATIHMVYNHLQLGHFQEALRQVPRATEFIETNSFNYQLCCEYEVYALMHLKDFPAASRKVTQLLKQTSPKDHPLNYARRKYLQAAVFFRAGRYRRAHLALQHTRALDKDKKGWNIGVRLLTIINQIAWGGLQRPTEAFVDNLIVHLREIRKTGPVPARYELILHILTTLVRNGFDFDLTAIKVRKQLALLEAGPDDLRWNPLGPEIVCFNHWFRSQTAVYDISN